MYIYIWGNDRIPGEERALPAVLSKAVLKGSDDGTYIYIQPLIGLHVSQSLSSRQYWGFSGGQLPASHLDGPGSIPDQVMWVQKLHCNAHPQLHVQ
jgi:hypothetical protein